jgi:pimeloyl-ACP methyl ester carboxylesterase
MYRKSWRYHRDSAIAWIPFFLLIFTAGYALRHPAYWIAVLLVWFLLRNPVRQAYHQAHPPRRISWVQETPLPLREVTFPSREGLTLFGRFVPSKNKATVLLVHDLGDSNQDMLIHAEYLAGAGFGVFLIDLRAHGSSDGDTSTGGRREADDVAGAVDYLLRRVDVNGQRIGALGISLGAQALLRGALKTDSLRALVLEGLSPAALSDHVDRRRSFLGWLSYPGSWLYYRLVQFMSGGKVSGVLDEIGTLAPRSLLLIAGGRQNISFNRLVYQAAKEPRELWEVPEGEHGAAILADSHTYIRRVTEFFQRELLSENIGELIR